MAMQQIAEGDAPKTSSKLPIIIGVVLALLGGGGGYFAASTGLLLGGESHAVEEHAEPTKTDQKVSFIDIEPLTISLPRQSANQHLRFRANLEVPAEFAEEVTQILPRVVDVMNSYLRALELRDLEDPSALLRLRSQMLRRVQVVAGPGKVNDLLVMEFVLN